MAVNKHISPPATASEIRRVLGITEKDRAAASQLLDLTAVQYGVSRRTGQAQDAAVKAVSAKPPTKVRSSKLGAKTAVAGKNRAGARKAAAKLPAGV